MHENQGESGTFIWAAALQKIVIQKRVEERQQIHVMKRMFVRIEVREERKDTNKYKMKLDILAFRHQTM
jgi:hypothetical protein